MRYSGKRAGTLAVAGAFGIAAVAVAAGVAWATETITYTYDARGRVVRVEQSGTVNNGVVTNYTFDDADNRKTMKLVDPN